MVLRIFINPQESGRYVWQCEQAFLVQSFRDHEMKKRSLSNRVEPEHDEKYRAAV